MSTQNTYNKFLEKAQGILGDLELNEEQKQYLLSSTLSKAIDYQMQIDTKAEINRLSLEHQRHELQLKADIKVETAKRIKEQELALHEYSESMEELLDEVERLMRENNVLKQQLNLVTL